MVVTIPPGGTLLDTFRKSFTDVPILEDKGNALPTTDFLDACESLTTFFDLLGSVVFVPVKNDLTGNITKLRTRQLAALPQSETLQDLVLNELKENRHEASEGLLWLVRGLEFTHASLTRNVSDPAEELHHSFSTAYKGTLSVHHSWVVTKMFQTAMRGCPSRADFYLKLGADQDKVAAEMKDYLAALGRIVDITKAFINGPETNWKGKK